MQIAASDLAAWRRHCDGEPGGRVAELTIGSLPGAFAATAAGVPTHRALRFGLEGDWLTHGQLDDAAARTAGWLVAAGLRRGERVLLCGHNTASLVIAYLAVLRCGAVAVPASPAYTAAELAHLVEDSGAEWAFASAPATAALSELPVRLVDLDEPLPSADPLPVAELSPRDLALLAYTSGTTGKPKGVPLTNGNLLSSIRAAMLAWRWAEEDVLVHALPLSHQHGLGGVHATLLAGSAAVILPSFDPTTLIGAARENAASVLFAVPAIYQRLVYGDVDVTGLTLRLAVSGSAPLEPDLARRVSEVLGFLPLERYGSTEAGLDVSNPFDGPRLVGTVGLPLPGVELRIGGEGGAPLPPDAEGEILLRGPQVFTGYWHRPEATAEAFHPDGWFRTGDLGRVDPDTGYLSITGRIKELIITGGLNVYPREVELALETHPAVAQAGVAGLPSRRWGEQVTAWVVAEAGAELDPAALIEHARTLLTAYKCPKQVFLVDRLPRNAMGKLQRRALITQATPTELDTDSLQRAIARLRRAEL